MSLFGGALAAWPLAACAQQANDRVRALIDQILRLQAEAAAAKISEFVREIEGQLGWMTQLPWTASSPNEWRFDAVRLLRQVPAITALARLDGEGREQAHISRLSVDVIGSQADLSNDPKFVQAIANKHYYGPVYFRGVSEPYMTISLAGARRDYGVVVAEVNIKLVEDVIRRLEVGKRGVAYVVDAQGRVIAHPDFSLIQRDFSALTHVQAARVADAGSLAGAVQVARDINGSEVLATYAPVAGPGLGWLVLVELPVEEVSAPAQ
jgi:hypothetical protein